MTFQIRHVLAALALHAALFVLLAGGIQCSRKVQAPVVMEAVLLDPSRQEVKEQKQRKRAEDERRRKEEEARRKQAAEEKRIAEEKRQAELALRKKAEDEKKKKAAEAARQKKELEQKKKAEEEARRKKEQDEQEFRKQLADEEEQRKRDALQRQISAEQDARAARQRDADLAVWVRQIEDKVRRNWTRPLSSPEDFQCRVRVQQLPGGQVVEARIVDSCGSTGLDESVVKAVLRSDPLPVAPNPAIFSREIIINFVP